MKICMTGIDYKNSDLSVREKFAVGKDNSQMIMAAFTELSYIGGCVIISTCNRTEVYVSILDTHECNISELLCGILGLNYKQFISRFADRKEKETFYHLCAVASGVDSQILGDDQIITQVRESLELSRKYGFTDSFIETMFRTAIKTGKEIKTKMTVRSERVASAPIKAIEKIKSVGGVLGKRVVVIGNGQMGRLVAELLIRESAHVTVTIREYKSGKVQVPHGAETIGYGNRYEVLEKANIVVSATTSPHYTVRYECFAKLSSKPYIVFDLAVPRDIDPQIGEMAGVTLFTIDDLGDNNTNLSEDKIKTINKIIENNMQGYYKWREYKELNFPADFSCKKQ